MRIDSRFAMQSDMIDVNDIFFRMIALFCQMTQSYFSNFNS